MDARTRLALFPALALAASLLSGCGGLTTPDLSTGEVSGRLVNVADPSKAEVYVVGKPEVSSRVGSDGSYRLSGVPVGNAQVVFYDGRDRAQVVTVDGVQAASRRAFDQRADDLAFASRVVVVARARGGAKSGGAAFTVLGSILRDRTDGEDDERGDRDGTVALFPVPAGAWVVRGELKGFRPRDAAVEVRSGVTAPIEVELEEDDSPERGCVSATCSGELKCGEDDGGCHECDDDPGEDTCGVGFHCERHACVADGAVAERDTCEPCTADEQCGSTGDGVCLGGGSGSTGWCAERKSTAAECDAGLAWSDGLCVPRLALLGSSPPVACTAWAAAFGSSCFTDAGCQSALAGGVCVGATQTAPGTCTAPCTSDSDCPRDVGFGVCAGGLCQRGQ